MTPATKNVIAPPSTQCDVLLLDAKPNRLNAGPKARLDTAHFLAQVGFHIQKIPSSRSRLVQALYAEAIGGRIWQRLLTPILGLKAFEAHWRVWCQFPITRPTQAVMSLAAENGASTVAFVHDLEGLKSARPDWKFVAQECQRLQGFTHVLSLNPTISQILQNHGIHALASLDLWDYRCEAPPQAPKGGHAFRVVFAGNLSAEKSGFIASLGQLSGVEFELYGNELNPEAISAGSTRYMGSFQPEAPPFAGDRRFGLVWDGPALDTCTGNFGAYLAYNTPHKASMYLARGLPVLIWRRAAIAPLIAAHGAGLLIDSLHEVPSLLQVLTQAQFAELQSNASTLGEKIRSGHFIQAAAARLIARLNPSIEK